MSSSPPEDRPRRKPRRSKQHDPFGHVEITDDRPEKRGTPPYIPTPAQRQMVTVFRAVSVPDYEIARQLGITKPTLYKYYREELDHGLNLIVSKVATSVVKKALAGNDRMIMFYLRTHGPDIWKDHFRHEHTGADGGPLTPPILVVSFLEDAPDGVITLEADERSTEPTS